MSPRTLSLSGRRVAVAVVVAVLLAAPAPADDWLEPVRDLDARGRTRQALTQLESDRARLAADPEARLLRGVLLAKLGRTSEARDLYQRLILEYPDRPEAYNNLAVMHAAVGDYDTAIEILKRGLGTHPSYRTAYENLTRVYGKLAGEAYSQALGDDRIEDQPLRLALINEMSVAAEEPSRAAAAGRPGEPPVAPREPIPAAPREPIGSGGPVVAQPQPPARQEGVAAGETATESEPAPDQQVWQTVEAWAAAWAGQRADDYLAFYGAGFEPADGVSRAAWEGIRRQRLAAPSFIRISLALLEVERPAAERATARFVQSYESDRFSDTVTKSLEMARTPDGAWKIVRESVEEPAE